MTRPSFEQVPMMWKRDGSLRDVCLPGAGVDGWSKLIRFAAAYRMTYKADGDDADFPGVNEVFLLRDRSHCLSIWIGEATANCHFFLEEEIEFDLAPHEVHGPDEHEALLDFIERAALVVGVNASITPEGEQGSPFMAFDIHAMHWIVHDACHCHP